MCQGGVQRYRPPHGCHAENLCVTRASFVGLSALHVRLACGVGLIPRRDDGRVSVLRGDRVTAVALRKDRLVLPPYRSRAAGRRRTYGIIGRKSRGTMQSALTESTFAASLVCANDTPVDHLPLAGLRSGRLRHSSPAATHAPCALARTARHDARDDAPGPSRVIRRHLRRSDRNLIQEQPGR